MPTKRKFSTIAFNPMVESVSRKFARRIDKAYNTEVDTAHGENVKVIPGTTYMGCSVRTVNIIGHGVVEKKTMFFRRPLCTYQQDNSEEGIQRRLHFSAAATWSAERRKNLLHYAKDVALFKQCMADLTLSVKGIHASGYNVYNIRGWLFAIGMAYLNAGEELPSGDLSLDA